MGRYVSWLANGALLVLCCFLVANTANAVIASWLAPTPEEVAPAVAAAGAADRSWAQRQLILDRNLFKAALDVDKAPPPPISTEELEATKLPLSLIGTAAFSDPADSWAAVEDRDARQHLVLKQGDSVKGKASVERIEPKRIVLREDGQLRELALNEDAAAPQANKAARAGRGGRAAARRAARARPRRPAARPTPPEPEENPLANAAQLFSEVNLVPKFEGGEMVGVQVDAIQPGSAFESAGIESGEVITELNGIRIDSQEQSQRALAEFAGSETLTVKVLGVDGNVREESVSLTPTN